MRSFKAVSAATRIALRRIEHMYYKHESYFGVMRKNSEQDAKNLGILLVEKKKAVAEGEAALAALKAESYEDPQEHALRVEAQQEIVAALVADADDVADRQETALATVQATPWETKAPLSSHHNRRIRALRRAPTLRVPPRVRTGPPGTTRRLAAHRSRR